MHFAYFVWPAEWCVDEQHGRHLHVEENGPGHDDETVGVALLCLFQRQEHEVYQAGHNAYDEERDDDGLLPALSALVVLHVEVAAALRAKPALVPDKVLQ